MSSFQKITLVGHAGGDPEVRYLESGSVVAKLSLAVTESYRGKDGHKVENTEWFRLEVWENMAKVVETYVYKGSQILVEGKVRTDKWTDKDGVERSGITIRVSSLTLLGTANQQTSGSAAPKPQKQQAPPVQNQPRANDPMPPSSRIFDPTDDDDTLPF